MLVKRFRCKTGSRVSGRDMFWWQTGSGSSVFDMAGVVVVVMIVA